MAITKDEDSSKSIPEFLKDLKKFTDKAILDVGTPAAKRQFILGAATGWFTGFLSTTAGNLAAAGFGSTIVLTHIATQTGYIDINWDKIYDKFDEMTDRIEQKVTGKPPKFSKKVERFVDRKLDKAEELVRTRKNEGREWYWDFSGDNQYHATESHVFLASFVAGIAIGITCS